MDIGTELSRLTAELKDGIRRSVFVDDIFTYLAAHPEFIYFVYLCNASSYSKFNTIKKLRKIIPHEMEFSMKVSDNMIEYTPEFQPRGTRPLFPNKLADKGEGKFETYRFQLGVRFMVRSEDIDEYHLNLETAFRQLGIHVFDSRNYNHEQHVEQLYYYNSCIFIVDFPFLYRRLRQGIHIQELANDRLAEENFLEKLSGKEPTSIDIKHSPPLRTRKRYYMGIMHEKARKILGDDYHYEYDHIHE